MVEQIKIEWQQRHLEENHGSGCTYWIVDGEDDNGNKFTGLGNYQGDELIDVTDIEEAK